MDDRATAFLCHQQARWLRPDASRWICPDAAKFLKPGTDPADVYPALRVQRDTIRARKDRALADALAQERAVLDALRQELAEVKAALARRKAERKYSANQPRVPAGNGSISGRWSDASLGNGDRPRVTITRTNEDGAEIGDGGSGDADFSLPMGSIDFGDIGSETGSFDLFDIKPREPQSGEVRLAGELPDGLGAPDDKPPKVPAKKPGQSWKTTASLRAITSFARKYPTIAGKIIEGLIKTNDWLEAYEDMIDADRDPPKTMEELQAGVGQRRPGYDTHHIIEQTAAERWGLTRIEINDESNLVSIPRLRHYQITGWYGTPTDEFGGVSPREYLSDKGPEERRQIGIYALVRFKVLKP